jgi:23S rRNA (guanosine2251-2'-O)-methyltransferase
MPQFIYGRRAVVEALRAGKQIEHILLARGAREQGAMMDLLMEARKAGVHVRDVPRQELDRIVPGNAHQGVAARIGEFEYVEVGDLLAAARERGEPAFLLLLDSVQDPQNFGTLLRTAEAVGVHGVVIAERRAVGVTPAVVKASAGAVEHLKIAQVTNLARTIEELRKENVWIVGVENDPGAKDYSQFDFKMALALVLGSEGAGLGRLVKEKCDFLVRLPMWGKIESLNVAVAGSIILYAAKTQRETVK